MNVHALTTLQEFSLNGSTAAEQAERARKQSERRARIISSMKEDANILKETRWPYVSSRAPVHPTPPPPAQLGDACGLRSAEVGGTLAAQLRAETTRQAMAAGRYDSREDR